MKFKNLKEVINYLDKINIDKTLDNFYYRYNLEEACISKEWYEAILEKVKKYKPKRVIDIGSNLNLFGYLFDNEGIEYIGIELYKEFNPVETDNIKFINENYYNIREQFKNDIIISCLCVGYLIPIQMVLGKVLIINDIVNNKCCAKEIKLGGNNE